MIFSGEKASDATKKARKLIENHTIVRERKLGLMLESEGVALCSCEWKSIAASNAVVMKQYVKSFRVDNCMSCVKHWMMDFKGTNNTSNTTAHLFKCLNIHFLFFFFLFFGLLGYCYSMKKIDQVVVVKEICKLILPQEIHGLVLR